MREWLYVRELQGNGMGMYDEASKRKIVGSTG